MQARLDHCMHCVPAFPSWQSLGSGMSMSACGQNSCSMAWLPRADHAGGAECHQPAAALLPRVRVPRLEPGRPGGDDLGVPRPHPHLHQAQGAPFPALPRPRMHAAACCMHLGPHQFCRGTSYIPALLRPATGLSSSTGCHAACNWDGYGGVLCRQDCDQLAGQGHVGCLRLLLM